ncbi:MAG: MFS transporter [Gammaproteobacteria bacterium]
MSTSRKIAYCAWLIASIFYAYQYVLRVMPNIMLTDIMHQFNIDAALFGQFSGAYYIGYCLMHLPIGIMLDRFGPKKVMSACILMTVIGLLPIIFAKYWIYPVIGRMLIGIGSSAAILGAFKIIRMIFSEQNFTKMLSFTVVIGLLGGIYGGLPISYLCDAYGYKAVVEILAILGVAFACITYFLVPNSTEDHESTVISDLKTVFTNRKVILVCCLAGLMVGPMEGFADAWGSEFLKQTYAFDAKSAHYLTSMIYIGMCFAPLLSRIAEKTGAYIKTIAGAGFIMLSVFALLISGILNFNTITVGFFIVGICCAYQILAIYIASTYVSEKVAGLTTAVANMIIMSFGYLFHSTIGIVIKSFSTAGNTLAFSYGICIIPFTLLIGAFGFFIISLQERRADKILQFNTVELVEE